MNIERKHAALIALIFKLVSLLGESEGKLKTAKSLMANVTCCTDMGGNLPA
jgi:hypothetical protein